MVTLLLPRIFCRNKGHKVLIVDSTRYRQSQYSSYMIDISTLSRKSLVINASLWINSPETLWRPLILNTFSDAKVIHIRRDPGATCWSNFKTFFLDPSLSYSFSIQGLVDYYQQYVDLMAQFHDLYGERLINIQYEDLTDKADTVIPALLDNLGLNFQEACLHPERSTEGCRPHREPR